MAQFATQRIADTQVELIKLPPHSVEAEQSVLGGLLLDNSAWDKIADMISESDFYRADHRLIYRSISRLIEHSRPADVITVAESLESTKELETVGGIAYVGALAQNTPTAANIRRYAEIVRERAVMRKLAEVGTEIADAAYNPMARRPDSFSTRPSRKYSRYRRRARAADRDSWKCRRCSRKWSNASISCTTATTPRTSPAWRPASPISTE